MTSHSRGRLLVPSPLAGEGQGGGKVWLSRRTRLEGVPGPPTLTLPRKGGGDQTSGGGSYGPIPFDAEVGQIQSSPDLRLQVVSEPFNHRIRLGLSQDFRDHRLDPPGAPLAPLLEEDLR